ncbi:MAG TPA: hypothetical protein DIV86_00305 [Alphaproteobacteria bacterium]|nr:hypothetical protein [Alphaproteobacteria bacterium]
MRIAFLFFIFLLSSCSYEKKNYSLLDVKRIYVDKSERKMFLLDDLDGTVAEYDIRLGTNPIGHKIKEGDGKTPEGKYVITWHNPQSKYYKSIRISYPNSDDRKRAAALGVSPGGDIMVHGVDFASYKHHRQKKDWTAGCIAVDNQDMDEIFYNVKDGTEITIVP